MFSAGEVPQPYPSGPPHSRASLPGSPGPAGLSLHPQLGAPRGTGPGRRAALGAGGASAPREAAPRATPEVSPLFWRP